MKTDDIISGIAFGLSFIQLYGQVRKVEEIDVDMKKVGGCCQRC